ncbi:hypothetical protein PybrP1_005260 [[Pythium] brassicae (nom. inval.)]|nr:hypothetical protein PybrP1_005260 [[Pythium] brassicae (nom. inval.)]
MAALLALPLLLAAGASAQGVGGCVNASALLAGASATEATAFDVECVAQPLAVDAAALALNASGLRLSRVRSLPRLLALDLSDNALASLQLGGDLDLARLELRANRFSDLSLSAFPPRLTYLDLRQNRIARLAEKGPWPANAVLQTLLLDENPLAAVDAAALAPLRSLQFLSLVRTSLTTLEGIQFPPSLSVLNASSNALDNNVTSFANLPDAIQYLDLSKNKLTRLPSRISDFEALVELSLASNQISSIEGVRFAKTLKKLNLNGNGIQLIEICRPDVATFAQVELSVPAFARSACPKAGAALETVNGTPVCVVEDCAPPAAKGAVGGAAAAAAAGATHAPSATPTPAPAPTPRGGDEAAALDNNSRAAGGDSSAFSSKAIIVIGGISFFIGVFVSALAFALYRKRQRAGGAKDKRAGDYLSFMLEARGGGGGASSRERDLEDDKSDTNWVFGDPPPGFPHAVALLEEGDAARKTKPGLLDDLLVFEIPPEEIRMKDDVLSAQEPRALQPPLLLAEYQGYQVVLHALPSRSKHKRRAEQRFIEQIRLASALDHPSLVQFIGLTFGASSRQHPPRATQRWKFAVVFEFMHRGSLAALFRRERGRREGTMYYETTGGAGAGENLFRWFPSGASAGHAQHPESDWRCKLSIALDVAMGLVYLHVNHVAHGSLSAAKVLVNDNGEAKLSALDVALPGDEPDAATGAAGMPRDDSMRQSARDRMRRMIGFKPSSFSQSQLNASLMHGGGGAALPTPTPTPSLGPSSPRFRAAKGDIYAFGLLLWELDTILSLDMLRDFASTAAPGEQPHAHLRFSDDCPGAIQRLAHRCWSAELHARPDALELQEELVQLLENRITTSSRAVSSWLRTTNLGSISSFSSSKVSESSSLSSASVYRLSEFETDV